MKELSTKPYLIRAIYEWCSDSGLTPYLSVKVDAETRVPNESVKDGEIILNVSADAAHHLTLGNDVIHFTARFSGVARDISVPVGSVQGIFAKETQQGVFFNLESDASTPQTDADMEEPAKSASSKDKPFAAGDKRRFQIVK